eukprot:SAG31_NODE_3625_length_4056_cov_1.750126_5_plen_46_part_00
MGKRMVCGAACLNPATRLIAIICYFVKLAILERLTNAGAVGFLET